MEELLSCKFWDWILHFHSIDSSKLMISFYMWLFYGGSWLLYLTEFINIANNGLTSFLETSQFPKATNFIIFLECQFEKMLLKPFMSIKLCWEMNFLASISQGTAEKQPLGWCCFPWLKKKPYLNSRCRKRRTHQKPLLWMLAHSIFFHRTINNWKTNKVLYMKLDTFLLNSINYKFP